MRTRSLRERCRITEELPRAGTLVMQCQGGARSAIATSLLRARGMENVVNLMGGITDWQASGLPVVRDVPGNVAARRVA